MSKEKYKGFILEHLSEMIENECHDFHDGWVGDGTYNTSYWTEVTNPRTLKTITFKSDQDAKNWIDNHKQYAKENRAVEKKRKELTKKIKVVEEKMKQLDDQKWALIRLNIELYNSKHPEFNK